MKVLIINDIPVAIQRKRVKNINLRITRPNAEVRVSAPYFISDSAIIEFVTSKSEWIRVAREEIKQLQPQKPSQYRNGDPIWHFGAEHRLKLIPDQRSKVLVSNNSFILHIPTGSSIQKIENTIQLWERKQLYALCYQQIQFWQSIIGVSCSELRIRKMKTKWGTCNIDKARIWLNLELVKYPFNCIEYVVVHELVHLIERYHNANFYAHMNQFLPDWQERKDQLNKMNL